MAFVFTWAAAAAVAVLVSNVFFSQIAGIVTIGLGLWLLWDPVASEFFALHSAHHGTFVVGWPGRPPPSNWRRPFGCCWRCCCCCCGRKTTFPGSFRIVGWLLLAAGAIMTFVGCCGCCGAWKLNQCALVGVGE